jgi:hypothetical protein
MDNKFVNFMQENRQKKPKKPLSNRHFYVSQIPELFI